MDSDKNIENSNSIDFKDIGKINLKEAEEIANEDILFINEDDLLAGLEEFNLIPLKDEWAEEVSKKQLKSKKIESILQSQVIEETPPEIEKDTKEEATKEQEQKEEQKVVEVKNAQIEPDADLEISKEANWIPLENLLSEDEKKPETESRELFDELAFDQIEEEIVIQEKETFNQSEISIEEYKNEFFDELSIDKSELFYIKDKGYSDILDRQNGEASDLLPFVGENIEDQIEYKDLDFVHFSIIKDDFSKYFHNIDDYYSISKTKLLSSSIELLGLTVDECILFDSILFEKDYEGVDFISFAKLYKQQKASLANRNIIYILSDGNSLSKEEKESIENDISTPGAVIFEENISDIKEELNILKEAKLEKVEIQEIHDITDKVVIIEDDLDIDRFIKEFPEKKQTDVKRLLHYFDGLFEKLPENTIKKFAYSEYYDLYIKVMNDMGL